LGQPTRLCPFLDSGENSGRTQDMGFCVSQLEHFPTARKEVKRIYGYI